MLRRRPTAPIALAIAVAAAVLAAGTVAGCSIRPASAATQKGYAFAAYGDIRPDSSSPTADYGPGFHRVMAKLGSLPHAFDVVVGDIIQNASGGYSLATTEQKYNDMLSQLGPDAQVPHVWVVGNHEGVQTETGAGAFSAVLHPGPHWYTYSYGDGTAQRPRVVVIVLSTEEPGMTGRIGYYGVGDSRNSAQADFLVHALQAHAGDQHTYLVVALHRPIADPKPNESFDVNGERLPLEHLFARFGVDLVLDGHVHAYVRHVMPDGRPYITVGTGGSPLYSPRTTVTTSPGTDARRIFGQYGFTLFRVDSEGMAGTTFSLDTSTGKWRVSDRFSVPQQAPQPGG
jgi:3',5'-cyclic AMP phosphodiesterase CpdA